MKTVHRIAFCALFAAIACARAEASDVASVVNRLRAPGGACGATAAPLVSQHALNVAASGLAGGASLEAALKAAGYRLTEAQVVVLTGERLHEDLEALLAKRSCAQIGLRKLSEIGVHERANQIWIVLAAPFAPTVGLARRQVAERTLALVNEARGEARSCGDKSFGAARPVRWSTELENAASRHAADMATNSYFSHTGRDGSTPAQRVTRTGYHYRMTGENIAAGQASPEEAVAGWIRSPGHCANLMNSGFTEMGVAFSINAKSNMGIYWVQHFGTPK
jgi:uncharacterized protein YkwD